MAGRYLALLIGNSSYPADEHNLQTLKGPVKDIAALNRALVDKDTGLFADADVTLLAEATSTKAVRALGKFFGAATRDDVLLVYFSGHGKLDQSGRLHLCMYDTESTDLLSTAVSSTRINEFADASRARNVVIVLDCCHSGAFRGGDLGDAVAGPGRYVLTSCRGSQLANDATVENGTSFFTQHFVDGLISAASDQDRDGYVTFSDLYSYVNLRLREAGKQIPQRRVDGDGDVRLAKRAEDHSKKNAPSDPDHQIWDGPHRPQDHRPRWRIVATAVAQRLRRRTTVITVVAIVVVASLVTILTISRTSHPSAKPGWPSTLGGSIYSRPFVANGTVYLGDTDGHIYALSAATGKRLWAYPATGHIAAINYRPQVAGNIVYVGTDSGTFYAIDGMSGKLIWQSKVGAAVRSSPIYVKGVIYFGTADNNIDALNAKDGTPFWKPVPVPGLVEHGPAVYAYEAPATPLRSRTIYVGGGGFLYALNAATGNPSWRTWLGSGDDSIPGISPDGKVVYVGGGGNGIYALNAKNGSRLWKHPYPIRAPVVNQPAASHGVVYFASGDYVYAITAEGRNYWKPHNFGRPVTGLSVANGSVYVGSGSEIYCLDETTGEECPGWRSYKANGLVSGPTLNYGEIYFGTQGGNVYALTPEGALARSGN